MAEPTQTDPASEPKASRTIRAVRRVAFGAVGVVVAALLLVAVVRVFIPTIPPEQTVPDGHFGKPCVACHFVIESAEEVEVE